MIIDVQSADAERLIENGKAEMNQESEPTQAPVETDAEAASEVSANSLAEDETQSTNSSLADEQLEDALSEPKADADETTEVASDPSAMLEALSEEPALADIGSNDEFVDEPVVAEEKAASL